MAKKKLRHFAENATFPHLFQQSYHELMAGFKLKGNWNNAYFHDPHPIILELGCGKGEYTVILASKHPEKNFIGIDIKGARMWKGCKIVQENELNNVAFIRTKIQLIQHFFAPGEIDEIWITFPDPQPKRRRASKRMTSPDFIELYRKILKPGGIIHVKTDNDGFFKYTKDIISKGGHNILECNEDIYNSGYIGEAAEIKTFYENMFLLEGIPIKYLKFMLNESSR